jgi:predicted dehydrogenase
MSATPPPLRWGILSTASIARKSWKAIYNSGNGVVVAVASRDPDRCRRFIAECQSEAPFPAAPRALAEYADVLRAKDVDAVYIPLPTALRKEWVLRAAAAGKHIVCEKPCAVTVADLTEMIRACRHHGVQFMDGVMFMHSKRLEVVRALLDDGQSIGQIRRINSAFNFDSAEDFFAQNIRASAALEPHGCLGDQGWYCLRFALWAMRWQMPRRVSGRILSEFARPGEPPVPTEFSGELFFDGGVSATFYCSFITALEQYATVSGARGQLRIRDFVVPFVGSEISLESSQASITFTGCEVLLESKTRPWTINEPSHGRPGSQETNLFKNFAAQVLSGKLNEAWPEWSLKTQQVLEACLKSARTGGELTTV